MTTDDFEREARAGRERAAALGIPLPAIGGTDVTTDHRHDPLDVLLADLRKECELLDANRAAMATDRVRTFAKAVETATLMWRDSLTDSRAGMRSGLQLPALRTLHARLMAQGDAWTVGVGRKARRLYRACCVPARAHPERILSAFERGMRGADEA